MTAQVHSISPFVTDETATQATALAPEPVLNRREFLTYAWGLALGLVAVEGSAATFFYLWPRFRPGEFGGKFELGTAATLPPIDAAPQPNMEGKFWLVNTATGPKALYMVCTHLGCLYKWDTTEEIFKCPCHGSRFDREGNWLKGPAARALDQFRLKVVEGDQVVAETGAALEGAVPPTIGNAQAQLIVDTGDKIIGRANEA